MTLGIGKVGAHNVTHKSCLISRKPAVGAKVLFSDASSPNGSRPIPKAFFYCCDALAKPAKGPFRPLEGVTRSI